MDLFLGLLCVTLAIVSAITIYFISVSSMKEKTYDEVKAEQKKKAEEYLAQGRSAKEKAKDKKLKKAGKKVKEKASPETVEISSEEVESGKPHVAFVEAPVVVTEAPIVIEEKKKKKNKKKEKPILINKNEITPVVDVPPLITNRFEQIVPKDDFTLKRSASREDVEVKAVESVPPVQKQSKPPQAKVEKSQTQKQAQLPPNPPKPNVKPKPVEEVVTKSTANNENASPSNKGIRKKRSELATLQQMSGEREAVNVNLLMPLVHKAELSRTEIQVLIDLLLNKQQGSTVDSTEWIEGRQDPVVKLKKQLAEKEKALVEEQEASAALQIKLRDLRTELNGEKHSIRQLEESLQVRQAELGSLSGRLQLSADEKQGLMQQIQQLQSKLTEEHIILCKLQEDQGQTQGVMQQELLAQRQQLEMHIARLTEQHQETIAALESQLGQMASQLQEQEAVNSSLSAESHQIKELMSKSQYDSSCLQSEVNSLTEQLSLKRAESDKLSSLVQNLQAENNRLNHQISSACVEAKQLRDENESLAAQVTASMERPATEGRENGDVTYPEGKHIDTDSDKVHEKELIVEQLKGDIISKEKELSHFKTDLVQKESLIHSMKADLDTAHSNAEKLQTDISSYKSLVQDQESVISALREEGDSAHELVKTLRDDINKSKAEIARLSKDCVARENTIEKLTSELNTHKTELADQAALIQLLQRDMAKNQAILEDNSRQEKLTSELNTFKTELADKEAVIKSLTSQSNSLRADIKKLTSELESSKEAVCKLNQQMKEETVKQTSLSQELQAHKRKNDEAEENARIEERERTKQVLLRLLPHISVDNKQDYEVWLEKFVACVGGGEESHNTMLAEVEQQNCQLQAMVTHYKAIIADTEGMLNRLQSHVEQEEGRWGQQIQTLEAQLEAVIQERDRLEENSELASQLEEALTRNKELTKELNRLQALLVIGEKSFSDQVQETVRLKEQIEDLVQVGAKNGLPTVDGGSDTN